MSRDLFVGPGVERLSTEEQIIRGILGAAALGQSPGAMIELRNAFQRQNLAAQATLADEGFQARYKALREQYGPEGEQRAYEEAAKLYPTLSGYTPTTGRVFEKVAPPTTDMTEVPPLLQRTPEQMEAPEEHVVRGRQGIVLPETAAQAAERRLAEGQIAIGLVYTFEMILMELVIILQSAERLG